uniref:hypothetical protein n=1 Tax=Candidatus Fimivicinus sp. TaxID=3056640 RepID=UPI003FEF4874
MHLNGFRVFASFRILLVWFHLPIDTVRQLSIDVGIPQTLKKIGVKEAELDVVADVYTGGNPRPRTKELVPGVYKTVFGA